MGRCTATQDTWVGAEQLRIHGYSVQQLKNGTATQDTWVDIHYTAAQGP
jgi:hypothetical protein